MRQCGPVERLLDVATLGHALARLTPSTFPDVPDARKAAVAAILRDTKAGAEVLLIQRAEHPDDPWSGHMAFPGGRVDGSDASALAAALRETREEVGLDLEQDGHLLGRLGEARTHLRPQAVPYSVVPFAFALDGDPPLTLNYEVQQVVWASLSFLADRSNRSTFTWIRRGLPVPMPSIRIGGGVLWGLTLRLIDDLLGVVLRD